MTIRRGYKKGFVLPLVLGFAAVVLIITSALLSLTANNYNVVKKQSNSNSALSVAEAGINYYLWHLSHNNQDYCDGNSCAGNGPFGPYTHQYFDTAGQSAGSYDITITPPSGNSTSVTVRSEGTSVSGEKRTVLATLGVPSFAQYSFVTNSEAWFGDTESTNGLVHSNRGIHYDGTANGVVASAVETYQPSSCFGGDGSTHDGVWGTGGPQGYWNFPVPLVDFNQLTSDLGDLQIAAQANGIHLPTLLDGQGRKTHSGYAIRLNADSTITVGKVTAQRDNGGTGGTCVNHPRYNSLMQNIAWESTNRNLPPNGIIFVADNAWVWGTVTSRLTIASGRLPDNNSTNTNIFLQNDISYTVKDGSVALGLISQADLVLNSSSEDDLVIDAYLLSQKGKVFRPYYPGNTKTIISVYGGIASNSWWTWSWVNGSNQVISGYGTTVQTYDTYLALNPPPQFPTTGSFAILSWKEEPIL
ncbi:MAG: hypothetical protein HZB70_03765 [Candidatus Berkelbacteria bacterium]|nr:MAG: hypothetical protein HZB70_03765 [Candidatus Berkelbacteria bacterium]QQG51584.1 MAG: hypothetical protein HY845_03425 [Candidatus Berkelbacteria bacterium]